MKLSPLDTNSPFIPLVSDYGFKVVFGNERNTLFLRKALQALLRSPVPIAEVIFDKNTFDGVVPDSRGGIYDLACLDERGRHFIVEMQLSDAPLFFHRMKFYAFHRFNLMVEKGQFGYDNLTPIYCIGVLANNLFPYPDYHTFGTIRNQHGQLLDDQITYVTVELDKFVKPAVEIASDLDKLIYTMKTVHTVKEPLQFPQF